MITLVGDFIHLFEKSIGDIREHRKTFVAAYNKYKNKHNIDWPRWDWEPYEYYTLMPKLTHVEFDSFIADRELHARIRKHIHTECIANEALRKIIYR